MPHDSPSLPEFVSWPTFPFEGNFSVRRLDDLAAEEPPRQGEDPDTCVACSAEDSTYIWVADRWRVRALDRPSGLPMVLILESRSHLDLGDLPNLLAAELGVMTVRLERAIRSLEGVARVHVNRWGDGSAHLHLWFLARPHGRLQLRGTFLSLWDEILPPVDETTWRTNLAMVAAWLAEFGGKAFVDAPRIDWQSPSVLGDNAGSGSPGARDAARTSAALTVDRNAPAEVPTPGPAGAGSVPPTGDTAGGTSDVSGADATVRALRPDPGDPEEAWGELL